VNTYVGIDPQVLEAVTGGNAEIADRIIERYLSSAGGEIEQLSELDAQGDRAALRRQAHLVVGAAATVGAGDIEKAARELEQAILDGSDEPRLSALVEQVTAAFGAVTKVP
jgi:HPt (histidine-containing phosphotransfer) domain-containing protein